MNFGFGVLLASWLITFPVYGQFSDDFSDGSLDGWEGDAIHFIVNGNQQLQLNAPIGTTSSWLYAPVVFGDSMVWEMYFKLDFAPSTSNQLKIYLGVNATDLSTASGYFLEIGASGDQDALDLKYLDQGSSISIASSAPGLVADEPVEMRIRVVRKSNGLWEIYKLGEVVPELLLTSVHDLLSLTELGFLGFNCKYTDTRRDKFFFDDIHVQPIVPDITAPTCLSINVVDSNSLTLLFDENLDIISASDASNYNLNPGSTQPNQIDVNQNEVTLHWTTSFVSQQLYTITLTGIKDLAGNTMVTDQKSFTYVQIDTAEPFELLITEIMADPTPVIGLPDAEYVEIFNASNKLFQLSDYIISVGTSDRTLPDEQIQSGEYIILTDVDNADLLSTFGRTIGIVNFPGLTNSGTSLSLKNTNNVVLHQVTYSSSWYTDPGKSDGGWALEMINPLHICSEENNWSEANNLLGGTPGSVNSQWSVNPDTEGPELLSLFTSSSQTMLLYFNEHLDPFLMENSSIYTIDPDIDIADAILINPSTVELLLAQPMENSTTYSLLPFEAFDCLGNVKLNTDTMRFGIVSSPDVGDVRINEILFNPVSGGSRYIELMNVSQKFINLSSLSIARITSSQEDIYPISVSQILEPGEIVVFASDPSDVEFRYDVPYPENLFGSTLPSWDDQEDQVSILSGGIFIDSFTYSSDWHHPVIADQNGVSLERISATSTTSSPSSWHSASSTHGYGTPTGINSQTSTIPADAKSPFTVTNRQFSPNDDGYKDFLALNFQLETGNEIGSAWIYDLEGREIRELLTNETLGTSTLVQWDGRNTDGLLADMGIYIIFVQLWDPNGNTREYQETCALIKR